jgi:hypothetical protein
MYGMMTKQLSTPRTLNRKKEWNNLNPANGNSSRDPKIFEKELSQPVRYPDPIINNVLLHATYGSTAIKPNAVVHFEQAQKIAEQSKSIGKPVPVGIIYGWSYAQQKATEIILNGLEESSDKTKMQVSPEQWRQLGADTPLITRLVFGDVKVGLPMTTDQQIAHLVITPIKYAAIGAGGAAAISLANNANDSAEKEIKRNFLENKEQAINLILKTIGKNSAEAINYATEKLNKIDINPVGPHCDPQYSHGQTFFTDVIKQMGATLEDEITNAAIALAMEHTPKTLLNIGKSSIKPEDVLAGSAAGAGIGLGVALYSMRENIQEECLRDIHCARRA